ncbi:zinc metalloproteinase nas-14-like [Hydractinia symbiolongicarpus]|uniref:zinc metalloproteinase nas-14-like n=1 Tax=Hydractinia symbiolongicarpus TaxID=13093 RepID=UPI00254F4AF1|nr:zinc metalloproteinase nas-14-like [Hydractinia symbiolongicarpus]
MKLLLVLLIAVNIPDISSIPTHLKQESAAMDDILTVNNENPDFELLYGDERLTQQQMLDMMENDIGHKRKRRALTKRSRGLRWPNNEFHYTLSNDFSFEQKTTIRNAINIIASSTCIRFMEHSIGSAPTAHVAMFPGSGCWSFIGRTGRKQDLSLQSNGCVFSGIIIHEVIHALGVYHEQSRADRDQFVTINVQNVQPGLEHNFNRHDTDSLGVSYDPKSVMHYGNRAFSNGNGPTIVWKQDPSLILGGQVLTEKDVLQLNLFYECSNPVTTTTTTTTTAPTTTTTQPTTQPTTTTTTTTRPTTTTTTTTRPTTTTTTTTRPTTTTTTTTRPTTTTTTTTRPTTTTTKPTTTTTSTTTSTRTTSPTTKTATTTKPLTTTTTTTTRSTSPPTGVCGDSSYYCISVQFKKSKLCGLYGNVCRRTCGLCTGPDSEMCLNHSDKAGQWYCKWRVQYGACQHRYNWYRLRVKKSCARSCCERGELYTLPGV